MQQRFPLPTLPFARDLHSGCVVGTSITLVAQPYDDRRKSFTLTLLTVSGETALRCEGRVGERGQVGLSSVTNGTESSEVTAPACLSTTKDFTLTINVKERVFEVFVNSVYCLEFLHRVEPLLARRLECDGPLSVTEVVVTPASVETLPPPPAYDQLNEQMGGMGIGGGAPSLSYPPPAFATLPIEKGGGAAPSGYPPTTAPPATLIHTTPALANRPIGKDAVRGGSTAPGAYPGFPPPPTVSGAAAKPPTTTTTYPGSSAPANSQYGNAPPAYPSESYAPVSTAPYSTLPAKPLTTTTPYPGGSSPVPANSQPMYGNTGTYPGATVPYSGAPAKPVGSSNIPASNQPIYGNSPYPGASTAPYPPTTNPTNNQSVYPSYTGGACTPYPPSGNVQSNQSGVGFKPQYSVNQPQSAGSVSAGASVADKAAFLEARLDRSRLESMRASGMNGQGSGYGQQPPQPYPPPPPQVPGGGYPIGQGSQGYPPSQPYPQTYNGAPPPPPMGAGAMPNPPMTNINPAFYGGPQYRGGTPSPPPPPQPIPGQYNYLAGRVPPYNNYPPTTQYPGYVGVGAAPVVYQQSYGGYAYPGYGGATVYGGGGGCESAHYRRRRSSSSSCSDRC